MKNDKNYTITITEEFSNKELATDKENIKELKVLLLSALKVILIIIGIPLVILFFFMKALIENTK